MTKYIIGTLVLVAAFLGLFAWGQQGHQKALQASVEAKAIATQRDGYKAALRASEDARALDAKVMSERLAAATKARLAAEKKAKALNEALKDNPGWADVPVPDSVRAAIADDQSAGQGAAPGGTAR